MQMKSTDENTVWEPEEAYREARSANLRLLIVILLIIAAGTAWIMGIMVHQKRTGEVLLNASMTFEEADRHLRNVGYDPMGLSYRNGKKSLQTYNSRWIFDCLPAYSMLETNEENNEKMLRLDHVFQEDGKHSMADPGEVFLKLKGDLSKQYGAPEEKSDATDKYLQWKRKDNGLILLGYLGQSMPALCYIWSDSNLSLQT